MAPNFIKVFIAVSQLLQMSKSFSPACFEFLLRVPVPLCSWHVLQRGECVCYVGREALKPLQQSAEWHEKLCSGSKIWAIFQSLPIARGPGNVWVYAQRIHGFLPSSAPVWLDNEYIWKGKWGWGWCWGLVFCCCFVFVWFGFFS